MYQSETAKQRHLTTKWCMGAGLDIASQGDPVVPWAWQFDLPPTEFARYNGGNPPRSSIQLWGHAQDLGQIGDVSLDFVYSSHLLEDFHDWMPPLQEWVRVLKSGGHLIILLPDKELWKAALRRGQPPNCAHRHEAYVGELSKYAPRLGLSVIEDRRTNSFEGDYSILFVGVKT